VARPNSPARDNLDGQSRKIATVATLATLEGLESQLQSHLGITLNTALADTDLRALVTVRPRADLRSAVSASSTPMCLSLLCTHRQHRLAVLSRSANSAY
jgi:alkylhydroperoxidase/carboxymuconolactone decarboxylase family protein YurZ